MKHTIIWKPSYSTLYLELDNWETISCEPWCMMWMDNSATIEWKTNWWFFKWLKNELLNWESFFKTSIKSNKDNTEVILAPKSVWDIEILELNWNNQWIIQSWSYLASTVWIETDTKFSWLKWFFSWEWIFMIKVYWKWLCFISSFWAIIEYNLKKWDKFIVDNSHIVAFESTLNYEIKKSWSWLLNMIKTGEWLVCEFSWEWKILMQTRTYPSFVQDLNPFLTNSKSWWLVWAVTKWIFW